MTTPTLKIEISFVESPSQSDDWTDVTEYLLDRQPVTIQRGRKDEFDQMQAGTATLLLSNSDRQFTADNADSPFYPYIKPKKRIRISGVWGGSTFSLFTGYIKGWHPEEMIYDDLAVRLDCIDALGAVLGSNTIPDQTLVDALAITASGIQEPLTGISSTANYAPMTRVRRSAAGSSFSGTMRFAFDGEWTPPLAWNITLGDAITAIEALSTVGPDVVYRANATTTPFHSSTIYFGQRFAGVDVSSRVALDTSNVVVSGGSGISQSTAAPAPAPTRTWGRINKRPVRFTISSAPPFGFNYLGLQVRYIDWDNRLISEVNGLGFTSTQTDYAYTNNWDQILSILMFPDTTNAGKTVTISIENTPDSTLSGDQFYAVARAGGMRAADIATDTGASALQTPTLDGAQALGVLQTIALSEGGLYFVDTEGVLRFVDRLGRYGGESEGTFGTAANTLPYQAIGYTFDDSYVKNAITITRSGGTPQYVQDIPSVDRYGTQTYDEPGLLITSDAEGLNKAKFILGEGKEPGTRINGMQLQGENRPDDLWPVLLQAELNTKYTIGNAVLSQRVALEYIAITANIVPWIVNWSLSPMPDGIFILDESLLDGTDVLLY